MFTDTMLRFQTSVNQTFKTLARMNWCMGLAFVLFFVGEYEMGLKNTTAGLVISAISVILFVISLYNTFCGVWELKNTGNECLKNAFGYHGEICWRHIQALYEDSLTESVNLAAARLQPLIVSDGLKFGAQDQKKTWWGDGGEDKYEEAAVMREYVEKVQQFFNKVGNKGADVHLDFAYDQ
jgi:hypothetical protein